MKKYKLIKEYPESPELGTIATYSVEHRVYVCEGGRYFAGLSRYIVENHPEFWEEVIEFPFKVGTKFKHVADSISEYIVESVCDNVCTVCWFNGSGSKNSTTYNKKTALSYIKNGLWVEYKEYEILSFIGEEKNISTLRSNGYYVVEGKEPEDCPNGKGATLHEMLTDEDFEGDVIHSIKRNSDGEVFTLGNLITGCSFKDPRKIDSFVITESKFYATQKKGRVLLEDMKKYREKPLFTSTDNYPIYQGETTYGGHVAKGKESFIKRDWRGNSSTMKYFKTKEGLDKYFRERVPIATTEDGIKVTEGTLVSWVINGEYCYDIPLHSVHIKTLIIGGETYKIFSTKEAAEKYVKSLEPLFISEDGVEMYEGSELHIVYIEKQRILSQPKGWLKNWKPIEGEKAFSTLELAEEYLIENKPSLSIQDVDNTITLTALEYAMLKKFVKDKK